MSKLLEKIIIKQINSYLVLTGKYAIKNSAYKNNFSTETVLAKINNDIQINLDNKQMTLLVLLDMSAAFDTVNHQKL